MSTSDRLVIMATEKLTMAILPVWQIELELKTTDEFQKRRKILKHIVERYLHKRKQESHQEDLEMLRWIKASQEMMWKQMKNQPGAPNKKLTTSLSCAI